MFSVATPRSTVRFMMGTALALSTVLATAVPAFAHPPANVRCVETVNPHGRTVPPAGSTTLPGPKGGQNDDGFYRLLADPTDGDADIEIFVVDLGTGTEFGPFAPGDNVKYTEANGAAPTMKKIGSTGGRAGAVVAHITGKGDMGVFARDNDGDSDVVTCLVPPPPK